MSAITTHVLDTSMGRPAAGMKVRLEVQDGGGWKIVGEGATDADGRLRSLLAIGGALPTGAYRISFDTGAYYAALGQGCFYPAVSIVFNVASATEHYHVPLLLSPFGYSTYRGS